MTTSETTTPTIEELEAKAEEIDEEVDELVSQLRDAQGQIARAQKRFVELDKERKVLAPKVFAGDSKAEVELEALEDEYDETARSVRVAEAAEPELRRMLEEGKAKLQAARRRVREVRAQDIGRQIKALDSERDAAADALINIIEKQQRLLNDQIHVVNSYDQDGANRMVTNPGLKPDSYLKKRFGRWLR